MCYEPQKQTAADVQVSIMNPHHAVSTMAMAKMARPGMGFPIKRIHLIVT